MPRRGFRTSVVGMKTRTRTALSLVTAAMVASAPLTVTPAQATYAGDNGPIAFRRYFTPDMQHGAVFTINPDGTGEVRVTHPKYGYVDQTPDVSPDGTRIAFQRSGPTSDEIWVVDADGTDARRLTGSKTGCQMMFGVLRQRAGVVAGRQRDWRSPAPAGASSTGLPRGSASW